MTLPTVTVEIAFTATAGTALVLGDVARGRLGTATLGAANAWVDVSEWVRSWSCRTGVTRVDGPVLRPEGGVATVVVRNDDRRFDPANLAGPYVAAGRTQVEPMRPIRIRATWDDVGYPLWWGYIDGIADSPRGPHHAETVFTCVDGFALLAAIDRPAEPAAGAGEDTGARVDRILDSAGWPALDRVVATGDTALQATTLEGPALTELLTAVESEAGECYVDAWGRFVFRNRRSLLTDARSATPQAVFGDGADSADALQYADAKFLFDARSVYNVARVAREGGTEQTREDADSRARYLTRTWTRTGLVMASDDDAASMAGWVIHQAGQPELRCDTLTLRPQHTPALLYPQALGRAIGDRITVVRRPPGGGDPIEQDAHIRGVSHASDGEQWTTDWQLQSASRTSFFVLGDPTLGVLGANALAY